MRLIAGLFKDAQFAARQLRQSPVTAIAIVLCLGLGIGANTAIFTAIDAVMLRRLPVSDPGSLVMLTWSTTNHPEHFASDILGGGPLLPDEPAKGIRAFSYGTFEEIRDRADVLSSTFAVAGNDQEVNVEVNGVAHSAAMQGVSGDYFGGLGVSMFLGRPILRSDDQEAQSSVAVLSHRFWQTKLNEDASIVGRSLIVNGSAVTIVGVAARDFSGLAPGTQPDFWIPLSVYMSQKAFAPASRSQIGSTPPTAIPYWRQPTTWWLKIFGRIKPVATMAQAKAELQILFDRNLRASSASSLNPADSPTLDLVSISHGIDTLRQEYSTSLFLLMGVVGLVLLIACGNVGALLLARATARQKEIAIRMSLGASRWRLIRQFATESILLALIGGWTGLFFAIWGDSLLLDLLSSGRAPLSIDLHLNVSVLAFTATLTILTGIVFGLLPALRITRVTLAGAMKQAGRVTITEHHGLRSGSVVVAGQVAICFVLIAAAGLLLRTLTNLYSIDAGFQADQLLLFTVRPGLNTYNENQLTAYYQNLKQRIESIPGVRSVTLSTRAPLGQGVGSSGIVIPGYTRTDLDIGVNRHQVGPDYFETLGIPIVMGRSIGEQDSRNARKVVVVNERLVRDFFRGENPIGHPIHLGTNTGPEYEVVGVAKDVKYNRVQDDVPPTIYYPYLQFLSIPTAMVFEVRQSGNASALVNPITYEASRLDRTIPVTEFKTEAQLIDQTFVTERTLAALSAGFGILALVLAATGLYGTVAYNVTRRTKEIGIRMALGADRGRILVGTLYETAKIALAGLIIGVFLALVSTPLLKSQLFGLAPHDAVTTTGAGLLISIVILFAGYLPARRAARIDPNAALHHE